VLPLFESIIEVYESVLNQENILYQLGAALLIILITLLIRGIFTRVIFKIILNLTHKTKTDIDRAVVVAFEDPLKFLILVAGIYLGVSLFDLWPTMESFLEDTVRSLVIVAITWGFYNLVGGESFTRISDKYSLDETLVSFLTKIMRFVIIALSITIVAQEWDYNVTGFIAGLGLGGLAFALAAKDTASNLFGGVIIILDKPFGIGDWIMTPNVEGTVEEMSFRSTKIRNFENALVAVPNSSIVNNPITNWTKMQKRRVSFHLGVTYDTPRSKLQSSIDKIKNIIEDHPAVHPDTIFVRFDQFSDSSLDLFIYFYTKTTNWGEWMEAKENINFKIMEILEDEGVSVAFPSRSIYFENNPQLDNKSTKQ